MKSSYLFKPHSNYPNSRANGTPHSNHPLSRAKVPLSQITRTYLLEIHHGWTFWFQGKSTSRLSANVSPIVSHPVVILQIPNQMWITIKEKFKLVILCDPRNLGRLGAPKAKPFADWHFFLWWHETSHMPTSRTLITNQHSDGSWSLPTQHTS
jgi:hypothetical protein